VQADTNIIQSAADQALSPDDAAAASAALDNAAGTLSEIAGEMEPPTPREPAGSDVHGDPSAFVDPATLPRPQAPAADFRRLLAIEVPVIVQLGMRKLTVSEVMRLAVGAIVEFGKSAEEELDLLANNKPIGKGHAVKVGENFGIKISTIAPVKETIRKLGNL
jgi:flagellar motor switch protein FliN/FliY